MINNAIRVWRKIFLKAGIYIINRPLQLPSNTTLQGEGANTVLRLNLDPADQPENNEH